jgi:hypothetical protein
MARDNIDYSHGDNGSEPSSALDFQQNQRPDAQNFDWFWSTVINRINGIISEFNRLDSNDDGKVDAADQADNADTLDGEHAGAFADAGHDHNHDELTNVGSSDHHSRYTDSEAVAAVNGETSLAVDITGDADTVDGQNYSDIQNWVNNNADVPNADHADHADTTGDADTVDGNHASAFADVGHNHDSRYYTKSEADYNFARSLQSVTADLSWQVSDFSALDNWSASSSAIASLTGSPKRLTLSVDESNYGASRIISDVLTTHDSLGEFRITFKDVSYTNTDQNEVEIGLREDNTGPDAVIAYYHKDDGKDYLTTTTSNGGTSELFSDIDWGSNHDITIDWNGIDARLLIDGVLQSSLSHSESADYRPFIEIDDNGNDRYNNDTIEVGEVIVEAL